MNKESILKAIKELKNNSKKRKFKESIDLIINLKNLDLKKPEQQVEVFVNLHFTKGKINKICGLVGPELEDESTANLDFTIQVDDFQEYTDKKKAKKLAKEYDFFVAQATIMPKVAQTFGKVLGPRGKMPNPKAGCVVPPKTNLTQLKEKLQNTVAARAKIIPVIQCALGNIESKDEELVDNIQTVYNAVVHKLPNEEHNVKNVYIKTTMGNTIEIK